MFSIKSVGKLEMSKTSKKFKDLIDLTEKNQKPKE
jgi:hypothetical protein